MTTANPACPRCDAPTHPIAGLATTRWEHYREVVREDPDDPTRRVTRNRMRQVGTMPFMCEKGHRFTADRPKHLQQKRPLFSKPRRGF